MKRINWIFGSAIFLLLFILLFELMNSDAFENWFTKIAAEKAASIQSSERSDESSLDKNQSSADTEKNTPYNKVDSIKEPEIDLKQINNIGDSIKKQIAEIELTQKDLLENGLKSNPSKNTSNSSNTINKIAADKSTKTAINAIINNETSKPKITNNNIVVVAKSAPIKPAPSKPIVVEKSQVVVSKPVLVKPTVSEKNLVVVANPALNKKIIIADNAPANTNSGIRNTSKQVSPISDNAKSTSSTTKPKQSITVRTKEASQPSASVVYATPYQPNIKTLPAPPIRSDGILSRKITQMEIDEFIRQFPDRSLNIQFVNFGSIDAEMENVKAQITYELSRYSYRDINKGWNQMSGYVLTDEVHFAANGPRGVIVYIPPIRNNP
ncbi:MAG: hypothetical protein Q8K64_07430 [Sediminibacterium sp.]|nr:hypothetical protein [Sediminibacterium sp.]